ncbi:MAG: hypothetical protein U0W24_07875 [Bacteroidales bacterium]
MNYRIITILVVIFINNLINAQKDCINIADSILSSKFQYLDSLLHIKELPPEICSELLNRCNEEVNFIVQLTGIESNRSVSGFMGRLGISNEDYLNWSLWYFRNKKYLYVEDDMLKIKKH